MDDLAERSGRPVMRKRIKSTHKLGECEDESDFPIDKPLHRPTDSYFSSSSGFTDYWGLKNLGFLLLVLSNTRVALENLYKYGILINPFRLMAIFLLQADQWPSVVLTVLPHLFASVSIVVELGLSRQLISENLGFGIQVVNLVLVLAGPAAVTFAYEKPAPIFTSLMLGVHTVLFLKLWSYASVNRWCRHLEATYSKSAYSADERRAPELNLSPPKNARSAENWSDRLVSFPSNLTLKNLYYFLLAPTLCYELNFPRTLRIRKRFLLKRIFETILLAQVIAALVQQWILPTVNNSMAPFRHSNFALIVTRLLKLAIPNHLVWLIFFYCFFHSWLNFLAELLMFADREFYRDWWNAKDVQEFWKTWNIPAHRWASRHIFRPLRSRGYSKLQASILVFVASAFFHEYMVSLPLRMFRMWAFWAMLGQVPLAMFVHRFCREPYLGNMAVWLSLIIGQPVAIMMYWHDFYVINAN